MKRSQKPPALFISLRQIRCLLYTSCLEQNIEGAQKIAYYMNEGEGLSVQELMLDIKVDHFQGYEFLLAIMLLVTDDSAIERTRNRLFIRWFRKELELSLIHI